MTVTARRQVALGQLTRFIGQWDRLPTPSDFAVTSYSYTNIHSLSLPVDTTAQKLYIGAFATDPMQILVQTTVTCPSCTPPFVCNTLEGICQCPVDGCPPTGTHLLVVRFLIRPTPSFGYSPAFFSDPKARAAATWMAAPA